jgi:hypothetical protein
MQDLLSVNDPDWSKFAAGDPEYMLRVCGATIREYCGWHIYPSLDVTLTGLRVQSRGVIMLPSLHVTSVASVTLQSANGQSNVLLDPTQYNWFPDGSIEPIGVAWYGAYSGYYYGPDNWSYLPVFQFGLATVEFTHGYDAVPEDIKQIAYEMTATSGTGPGGGGLPSSTAVKEISSPGFRLQLGGGGAGGLGGTGTVGSLTDNQKNRLAPYRIGAVA